jgi:hypothetical protein
MQLQQNIGCSVEHLEQIDHPDPGSSAFSGGFAPFWLQSSQGGQSAPFAALEDDACPPPHAGSPHQLR